VSRNRNPDKIEAMLAAICPLKRSGHPEDIANMALFLASDEAQWITGTAMVVDGGWTAGNSIEWGGDLYANTGYAGPSFTATKS
jgi:NAD(P)-dependent dehydrogenase (short-subunit alcohol dehydrogenase family)